MPDIGRHESGNDHYPYSYRVVDVVIDGSTIPAQANDNAIRAKIQTALNSIIGPSRRPKFLDGRKYVLRLEFIEWGAEVGYRDRGD